MPDGASLDRALTGNMFFNAVWGQNSAAEKNVDTSRFWVIFENSQNYRHSENVCDLMNDLAADSGSGTELRILSRSYRCGYHPVKKLTSGLLLWIRNVCLLNERRCRPAAQQEMHASSTRTTVLLPLVNKNNCLPVRYTTATLLFKE